MTDVLLNEILTSCVDLIYFDMSLHTEKILRIPGYENEYIQLTPPLLPQTIVNILTSEVCKLKTIVLYGYDVSDQQLENLSENKKLTVVL